MNINEVNQAITELEGRETSFAVCEKLASLYVVRDHINKAAPLDSLGDSEFLSAATGVSIESILFILDEHMKELKILFPKEYEVILSRILNA